MIHFHQPSRGVLAAFGLVLLIGCGQAPPPPDVPPDAQQGVSQIDAAVAQVNLFDERYGVHDPERSLHMPQTAIVGKHYDLTPAVSAGDRELIENETRQYFAPGDRRVEVDVYIMRGKQSFEVGEMKETLRLEFAVRIEIANQTDVNDVVTAEGESALTREAGHLDRDSVPGLYAQVMRESVADAFGRILARRPQPR